MLQERDLKKRRRRLDALSLKSEDLHGSREYMKQSSLWTMLEDAKQII